MSTQGLGQNVWLAACFFVSCYFYGAGHNPTIALPALLAPLLIIAVTPASRFNELRVAAPLLFWGCGVTLALIALHHCVFSTSPDSSFIPSLLLACLPLWVLCVSVLENPRQLWVFLVLLGTAFASTSVLEFLVNQQRAHAPLRDPGNFVSLLYLIWLPWVFDCLRRELSRRQSALLFGCTLVFSLAMLATHSRFAMLVLLGVVAVLGWVACRLRARWQACLNVAVAICCAFAVYLLLDPSGASSAFDNGDVTGAARSPRMLLWGSAWDAIVNLGGVNGTGAYTFTLLYPLFRSPFEQTTAGLVAHNDVLQIVLEGGIWLGLPLLFLFACIGFSLARNALFERRVSTQLGLLLALGIALFHSMVNFVFYVLPLVLLVAVLLALAFAPGRQASTETPAVPLGWRAAKYVVVALLGLNALLMALDIMTMGVLSSYRHAPGADYLRAEPSRMLAYTRIAQTLNPRRSLPLFGEAKILEHEFRSRPTPLLATQIDGAYAAALGQDPWNPSVHINYAAFKGQLEGRVNGRDFRQEMLYDALALNPYNLDANAVLLQWHLEAGENLDALAVGVNVVKWCKLLARHPAASALFGEVERLGQQLGAQEISDQAADCVKHTRKPTHGGRQKTWLMRLMGGTLE